MAITKQKGDIAEAFVTYLLKQNGFNVLVPWGEDNRYDLVSEKNGVFKRIQVKYVTPKNGTLNVSIRSSNNYNIIHYSLRDIDVIAAYHPRENKVYFIPLNHTRNISSCKLRLRPTKNKQKKFIIMASKYESRFDLLEK
ncbi:MAG: group I intron-associated PD-(D/E)XK endonuclease [Candidatus Omnitrophota bacterium]|nr:group I intron-associated PD-(D/E)XK endonuclease [Candidatus Omnitrophota bacterium]